MFVHFSFTVDKHAKPTLNKKLVDEKNRGSVCDLILLGIGALPTITPNPNSCLGIRVVCASACQATNQATWVSHFWGRLHCLRPRRSFSRKNVFFQKFSMKQGYPSGGFALRCCGPSRGRKRPELVGHGPSLPAAYGKEWFFGGGICCRGWGLCLSTHSAQSSLAIHPEAVHFGGDYEVESNP